MGLHTRGFKFCKLRNGSFVNVPPVLVQRCKSQFHTLPCGVDVILGLNGYIWVNKKVQALVGEKSIDELDAAVLYSNENDVSIIWCKYIRSLLTKGNRISHLKSEKTLPEYATV